MTAVNSSSEIREYFSPLTVFPPSSATLEVSDGDNSSCLQLPGVWVWDWGIPVSPLHLKHTHQARYWSSDLIHEIFLRDKFQELKRFFAFRKNHAHTHTHTHQHKMHSKISFLDNEWQVCSCGRLLQKINKTRDKFSRFRGTYQRESSPTTEEEKEKEN